MAMVRTEPRLLHIVRMHADTVITGTKIQFSIKLRPSEFIKEFFHHQNWKFIFDGLLVERTIIHKISTNYLAF